MSGPPMRPPMYTGPPPSVMQAALPAGWSQHFAPNGQPYYFNAASGQSTHVHPSVFGAAASTSQRPPPASSAITAKVKKEKPKTKEPIEGAPGWLRVTTNLGNVFYTHKETKRSEWTVPDEIKDAVADMDRKEATAASDDTIAQASGAGQEETTQEQTIDAGNEHSQIQPEVAVQPTNQPPVTAVKTAISADKLMEPPMDDERSEDEGPNNDGIELSSSIQVTEAKRKREASVQEELAEGEGGIDLADLIGPSEAQDAEGDAEEGRDGEVQKASNKRPRTEGAQLEAESLDVVSSEGDDRANESEDEDEDAEWQRQLAAEMAAEADESSRRRSTSPAASLAKPPKPSAPPQPPLPAAVPFVPPVPPLGGYAGPPPSFIPPPAPAKQMQLSFEEGRALFTHMLTSLNNTEHEVNPMAPWDKELPKFVHRSEYGSLGNLKDRQDAFNDWCKHRLREKREQRKSKTTKPVDRSSPSATNGLSKAASPAGEIEAPDARSAFADLLREYVTSTRTRFEDFRRDHKKDPRFYRFGRDDREREKSFKSHLRELGERKKAAAEAADAAFLALLADRATSQWQSEWEKKSDEDLKKAIWPTVKKLDGLEAHPSYDAVGSSSRRAELFVQWAKGQSAQSIDTGKTAATIEALADTSDVKIDLTADKEARRARALAERESQARMQRQEYERQNRRALGEVNREGSTVAFGEFLVNAVRDPFIDWITAVRQFSGDPAFDAPGLNAARRQTMFEEHVAKLIEKKRVRLHELFAKYAPSLDTSSETTLPLVREDEEYSRLRLREIVCGLRSDSMSRDEMEALQEEWKRWQRFREADARAQFDEMLKENSFVDFWGRVRSEAARKAAGSREEEAALRATLAQNEVAEDARAGTGAGGDGDADLPGLEDMAAQVDLEEIHSVLRSDARYRAWKHKPDSREAWIREYLESLTGRKRTVWSKGT